MAILTKRTPTVAVLCTAIFLLVALLAGCSADSPSPASDTPEHPTAGSGDPEQDVQALVDVRSARHADFDRIVFEFDSVRPDYQVEYVSPPFEACDSDRALEVAGEARLQVRFSPATARGIEARRLVLQYASLGEAIISCDFEGDVTWLLGLTAETNFAITEPGRDTVVIDIAHPIPTLTPTITATPRDTHTPPPAATPAPRL